MESVTAFTAYTGREDIQTGAAGARRVTYRGQRKSATCHSMVNRQPLHAHPGSHCCVCMHAGDMVQTTQRGPTRPGPALTCYGILSVGAQALEAITRQRSCRFQHTITRAQFVRVKLHAAHTGSTAAGQGSQHPHANRRRRGLITGMLCGGHEVAATVDGCRVGEEGGT